MKQTQPAQHHSDEVSNPQPRSMPRRTFVKVGAMAAVAAFLPRSLLAAPAGEKSLAFFNTHTSERLRTVYWAADTYVNDALREIDHVLRDPRTDEVHEIDPRLLDLLFAISKEIAAVQPFHVISGYRSPTSNAFLRSRSTGVAKNSLHLVGKAIDIRLPGRSTRDIQQIAIALRRGGVGYYPKSDFVHVDVGRVRYW